MKPRKYISTLVLCLSIVGTVFAQWEWAENVTRVGNLTLGRDVVDLAISGEYAYCADNYGLSVWDLSEPERPVEIARAATPGLARCVAIQGHYAFIGDFHRGLAIFDVSNPQRPMLATYLGIDGFSYNGATPKFKIVIQQQRLYLLAGFGLWIISVADPIHPELIGHWTPEYAGMTDIIIHGSFAYISGKSIPGLYIVNIENPASPRTLLDMNLRIYAMAQCDTILYCVADSSEDRYNDGRFYVLGISDPGDPQLIGSYPQYRPSYWLFLDSTYCHVSGWWGGNRIEDNGDHNYIYDISNPRRVQLAADNDSGIGGSRQLKKGNYCIAAASSDGLASYSLVEREHPRLANELLPKYDIRAFDIDGDFAYLHAIDLGLVVVDIRDRRTLGFTSELSYSKPRQEPFAKICGHYLYFGGDGGIVIDIQNPDQPDSVGEFRFWTRFENPTTMMYIRDGYGYFPFSTEYNFDAYNLFVFDLSDPAHPDSVAIYNDIGLPMPTSSMEGDLLFQTGIWNYPRNDQFPQVFVYSLQEPGRPRLLGHWPFGPEAQWEPFGTRIMVHNGYAYIWCALVHELWIYNVENPIDPRFVRSYGISITALSGMAVEDDILYLGGYDAGFGCISIADPENPEIVGYYDTPGSVYQIKASDGYVYIADDFEFGIYDCAEMHGIWDLQASEQTHNYGYVPPDSTCDWEMTLTNQARQNVTVLGITTDSAAFHVAFNDSLTLEPDAGVAVRVAFSPIQARIYTATLTIHTARRDIHIALTGSGNPLSTPKDMDNPSVFALYPSFPNPFNSEIRMQYNLPISTDMRLTIYDVTGRETISLFEGRQKAGQHNVKWNGKNSNGVQVPSGIYLIRYEATGLSATQKIVLIQ